MEKVCDLAHITLNKNSVFGDASAVSPGGVRIGAPAMTSRGLAEKDFESIADFLDRAVKARWLFACFAFAAWCCALRRVDEGFVSRL